MRILDAILTAQIDRALDDGRPLPKWVGWFVRRNERLRRYFDVMLAMETELRSPQNEPWPLRTPAIQDRSDKRRSSNLFSTLSLGLLLVSIGFGLVLPMLSKPSSVASVPLTPASDEVVLTTLTAMSSFEKFRNMSPTVVPEISFWIPKELPSMESVADFAERPLEQTSTLLGRFFGEPTFDESPRSLEN